MAKKFAPIAQALGENEEQVVAELLETQGKPVDLGGYYKPSDELADKVMRPSATLNGELTKLK